MSDSDLEADDVPSLTGDVDSSMSSSQDSDAKTVFGFELSQENVSETFKSLLSEEDEDEKKPYSGNLVDRIAYSFFGGLFRGGEDTYADFNRALNQARIPVSYDVYLSRVMMYGLFAIVASLIGGVAITILTKPILLALGVSVRFPPELARIIDSHAFLIRGILVTTLFTSVTFSGIVGTLYYYPFYVAGERGREIDAMLPHAVTYCYAMSRGGVSILDVMRSLAQADDTYGEVSKEFAAIINNVDYVQEDLRTAVREEAAITPSDDMRTFLEDMLNVIDSGSDMDSFFYNKSEVYLRETKETQEQTLEVLELMSEAYVTLFVASPIFVLVVLLVMSLMGGAQIMYLYGMTYFGLPMGAVFFIFMMKILNMSPAAGGEKLERNYDQKKNVEELRESVQGDPRYKKVRREETRRKIINTALTPVYEITRLPWISAVFTIPAALSFIYWVWSSGITDISIDAFTQTPVVTTAILVLIPIYIICIPISVIFELENRREKAILKKLPEAFKSAADANARGLDLEESFRLVAENSKGAFSQELAGAFQQAQWTGDIGDALAAMANQLRVPRLSRTLKLITEANYSSGDIQSVLEVAARDVENMHKLERDRKQNAMMYLVIISVAFIIALGVIVMLDVAFLSTIAKQAAGGGADAAANSSSSAASSGGGGGGPAAGGFGDMPIQKFRMAFLHTTMVLGLTAGLVIGAMANDSVLSGLKFALTMMGIAVGVFFFA